MVYWQIRENIYQNKKATLIPICWNTFQKQFLCKTNAYWSMYVCADRPVCRNILKLEFWSHHDDNPAFTISAILLFDDPWFLQWLQRCYRETTFRISSVCIYKSVVVNMRICIWHVNFLWLRFSCVDEFHKDVVFIYEPDIFIYYENIITFFFVFFFHFTCTHTHVCIYVFMYLDISQYDNALFF